MFQMQQMVRQHLDASNYFGYLSNVESLRGIATDDITPDEPTLIDNVASYPTPEGLLLSLTPAGVLPRVSAWLIDSLIRIVIYMVWCLCLVFWRGGVWIHCHWHIFDYLVVSRLF